MCGVATVAVTAKDRWQGALRRLRLALTGEADAVDILERSRERIWNAREALEREAPKPRRRPLIYVAPPFDGTDTGGRPYFVLILDPSGVVNTHTLLARDDDEATARARAQADQCAFDIWEGWRFEPQAP